MSLNETIFRALHGLLDTVPWLEPLVSFGTKPLWEVPIAALDSAVIALVLLLLFLYYDGAPGLFKVTKYTWRKVIVISLTGVIAWSASAVGKALFLVPRPYIQMLDIEPLFQLGILDSFPSGHATFFAAIAVAVWHYHRRLGFVYVLAAIAIGVSRIIAGVHFPLDILAGFLLGGGGALLMMRLVSILRKKGIAQ